MQVWVCLSVDNETCNERAISSLISGGRRCSRRAAPDLQGRYIRGEVALQVMRPDRAAGGWMEARSSMSLINNGLVKIAGL